MDDVNIVGKAETQQKITKAGILLLVFEETLGYNDETLWTTDNQNWSVFPHGSTIHNYLLNFGYSIITLKHLVQYL